MSVDRRSVLKGALAGAAVGPFAGFANAPAGARPGHSLGALVPVKDQRDGAVRLHLPRGFSYRSFHDTSQPVELGDGTMLPGRHDGMGAFKGPGSSVLLVRNHEVNNPQPAFGPGDHYDDMGGGGTTTIQVDRYGHVVNAFTSLSGTMMNCSGGQMPWGRYGSWVSCEETVNGPDVGPDFTGASNAALEKRHGYIFDVPASPRARDGRSDARPITRAGRFAHEAVSYSPKEGALYLTEDNFAHPSGFYRYTPRRHPKKAGHLDNEGTLQMLRVKGRRNVHLEARQRPGATYDVEWVDIEEPNPEFSYTEGEVPETTNDEALVYVGDQGRAQGASLFSRLEGQVYDAGVVYFTSTQGGGEPMEGPDNEDGYGRGFGQVWAYDTRRQQLRCIYQSTSRERLDFPDNVTTSARGTLVVCEDHDERNYLRGLTPEGRIWSIARNAIEGRNDDEFAGSTFSPDGRTLFVNIQAGAGMTFAIWGPWGRIGV